MGNHANPTKSAHIGESEVLIMRTKSSALLALALLASVRHSVSSAIAEGTSNDQLRFTGESDGEGFSATHRTEQRVLSEAAASEALGQRLLDRFLKTALRDTIFYDPP